MRLVSYDARPAAEKPALANGARWKPGTTRATPQPAPAVPQTYNQRFSWTPMTTPKFTVADIRQTFLDFFERQGPHDRASSPLVPGNDPTLLFTNSGMVQFKDVFLGTDKRPYVRAASVQRCLRAGGKHNDLENVGYTARHHTFFEMLGNWSASATTSSATRSRWAWELLTEVYKLPADKLWATVYIDDDEAYDIWTKDDRRAGRAHRAHRRQQGRALRLRQLLEMADTGPCGPCSEIFYDHGPDIAGGPPGSPGRGRRPLHRDLEPRVHAVRPRRATARCTPLPKPCVDTGMGLERLAAVLQHVHSQLRDRPVRST